ncbi:PA domain-containing protein [Amycolatopsis xylanica]|uniref:PA domain-containing protein n=1 Tax=Amycolatopsis xylanica TaxID=589385 RepID=A0A1H3N186_9PSEU|nr:M28 family peptidase [Amycolatopsis xylanica]SDY82606.1 PA domain-containing protein [Amycolatopsis xylanica]
MIKRYLLAALLPLACAVPAEAHPSLADTLAREVSGAHAWHHLQVLSAATLANGGTRVSGSPGYQASADYVTKTLTRAGYRVHRQEFSFPDYEVVAEKAVRIGPEIRELHPLISISSVSTPDGGLTAQLAVPTGKSTGCVAEDYAGADVTGKIVLVDIGGCPTGEKQLAASGAGAVAMLMNVNSPNPALNLRYRILPPADARIPTATVSRAEAEYLRSAASPVTVLLELRTRDKITTTFNLIADTATGDAERTVVMGAHLDSVETGPGVNDNAAASAMVLETAVRLAPHAKSLENRVRFAWWAGEEKGLLGSQYYVNQLSPEQRRQTALYLNLEMIGSPNFARQVYDGQSGPPGSTRISELLKGYFAARKLPTVELALDGRSDHAPFAAAGIPAGGVNGGAEKLKPAEWVALFGGTEGEMLDHCYHQLCDTLDNVNKTIFDQFGRAMAWTLGRFAGSAHGLYP